MGKKEQTEIDLLRLLNAYWHRLWMIVIAAIVCGGLGFSYAAFILKPTYKAEALMYVNNSSISVGSTSFSISPSDLSAAQSLVDTYVVILKTRTTLEKVIEKADLKYTYEQLSKMISSGAISNTEVFNIDVTSNDPAEAELIANTIAKVLPDRISGIVDGSSVRIVDYAVKPSAKAGPSITKYSALGFILGCVLACGWITFKELTDTLIREEDQLLDAYPDIPVLAVIPDVNPQMEKNKYKYASSYNDSNKKYTYQ